MRERKIIIEIRLPQMPRKRWLYGGAAALFLVGGIAYAAATWPANHTGQTLSATDLDGYLNNLDQRAWSTGSATMRSFTGGNVGIGASPAPTYIVDINNPGGTASARIRTGATASGAQLSLERPTATAPAAAVISWITNGNPDFQVGTNVGSAGPSDLGFYSYAYGHILTLTKATGSVQIGGPNPAVTSNLYVNGTAAKTGGGTWDTPSDERLKIINGAFTSGLNEIMRLQPIRYRYREHNALGLRADGEHIGFTAQAVQKVIPEAVSTNADGYLFLNSDPIVWSMVNAIKDLKLRNDALEKENASVRERLSKIEAALSTKAVTRR